MSEPFCAAVDWGTSSFRLWLLDAAGQVLAARRSEEGMAHCAPDRFAATLEAHLASLGAPAALPAIICGMAGSRQGWQEAPYEAVPAPLARVARGAVVVPTPGRDIRILPGICQRDPSAPDVMRGEETQLLGAFGSERGEITACLPGTHSKWVRLSHGAVTRLRTFMTGELYAAIRGHTILAHSLLEDDAEFDADAFRDAVARMLDAPHMLTAELFALRAGHLLALADPAKAASRLSGLLIGAEIAAARSDGFAEGAVSLLASGPLGHRYSKALAVAGVDASHFDAEKAVIAGLYNAALKFFATGEPVAAVGGRSA